MPDELRLTGALILSLTAAYAATPLAIRLAQRKGFHDHPSGYKAHRVPTPYLGGAAVMAGFVLAALTLGGGWWRYAPIVAGALLLWAVGTLDDHRFVPPSQRVFAATVAATFLWATGLGWSVSGSETLNLVLTILWVIGLVNAFNLMDNMDGAASTVASVCATGIAVLAVVEDRIVLAALALALCGACLGFLPRNLADPARIFLGDGGSMPIGFVIAAAVMALPLEDTLGWTVLFPATVLVGLPVFDTALVIVSRLRRGAIVWRGGRDHITHRLATKVGSVRAVAFTVGLIQASLCGIAILAAELGRIPSVLAASSCLIVAAAAGVLVEKPPWAPPRGVRT